MEFVYTVCTVLAVLAAAVLLANRLAPLPTARLGMGIERWRAGLQLARVAVPGFVMPYLEGGHGAPLVLVHGFSGDKDNFIRIARFLTPHYRVVIPDLPGFGDATRNAAASYTIAEQVERLRAFLDQVAPGTVHLGGNSMGGFIVAQFAATYPERVASLWLLDAAGTAAAQSTAVLERYRDTGDMPLLLRHEGDMRRLLASTTHRTPFLPYCVRVALGRRGAADHALHSRILQQLTTAPLLEQQYRQLAPPTLIVWGQQDRILHPSGAAALGALCRRSRTIVMPGIGHLPMLEAPHASARDYLAFRREYADVGAPERSLA